jgi:hypothetical protein
LWQHPQHSYFLFIPSVVHTGTPLVVTVHGIARKAREQIEQFRAWAERYQAILLAPLFSKVHFRDYQRLGRVGRGQRADLALEQMITEAANLTGIRHQKAFMFGYSGGGQFVHRFAMAYPHKVERIAIGAAGWYTYPDLTRRYPYGIQESDALPGLIFNPAGFLKIPALVVVGEWDNERDPGLNQARHIDRRQGITRIERGKRWTAAMRDAATKYGFNTDYRFEVLPASGHSFMENMQCGNLGQRIFKFFFEHPEIP